MGSFESLSRRAYLKASSLRALASGLMFLVFLAFLLTTAHLQAATVKNKMSQRQVVVIDEGSNAGVSKGDEVCFFDDDDVEVGCGTVRRAQSKRAFVKVSADVLKQVKKGYVASYGSSSSGNGGGTGKKSSKEMVRIRPMVGWNITQPYSANFPDYTKTSAPYWDTKDDNVKTHKLISLGTSAYGGIEVEVVPAYTALGFRYNFVNPNFDDGEADYKAGSSQQDCNKITQNGRQVDPCYLGVKFESQSMGFWLQFMYGISVAKDIMLSFGLGADLDMSTLTFNIDQKNSRTNVNSLALIKDAESKIMSWGIRVLPLHVNMDVMDGVGLYLSGVAVIGVYPTKAPDMKTKAANFQTSDFNVDKSTNKSADMQKYVTQYFRDAVNHGPGLGFMVHGGLQVSF